MAESELNKLQRYNAHLKNRIDYLETAIKIFVRSLNPDGKEIQETPKQIYAEAKAMLERIARDDRDPFRWE